jgi:tetratricopeptide (TPR) repeat protein
MKNKVLLFALLTISSLMYAQNQRTLLGVVTRDSLLQSPYNTWFSKNYEDYRPDSLVMSRLKKTSFKKIRIEIFFGTWCGDSKREVPRFLKIVDALGIQPEQIKFIAVHGSGDQYKQSLGGETVGKDIYRVATFIFYEQELEINRIIEHPLKTLEHDIEAILLHRNYQPSYKAFKVLDTWKKEGTLLNTNTSLRGLAKIVKPYLYSDSELYNYGYVQLAQGSLNEAVAIAKMATFLYSEKSEPWVLLAEATSKNGNHSEAQDMISWAIQLNNEDSEWPDLLNTYYEIRKRGENDKINVLKIN